MGCACPDTKCLFFASWHHFFSFQAFHGLHDVCSPPYQNPFTLHSPHHLTKALFAPMFLFVRLQDTTCLAGTTKLRCRRARTTSATAPTAAVPMVLVLLLSLLLFLFPFLVLVMLFLLPLLLASAPRSRITSITARAIIIAALAASLRHPLFSPLFRRTRSRRILPTQLLQSAFLQSSRTATIATASSHPCRERQGTPPSAAGHERSIFPTTIINTSTADTTVTI